MNIFDGTQLADKIADQITEEISALNVKPTLAIFAVTPNKQSDIYIAAKRKRAKEVGIKTRLYNFDTISTESLVSKITAVAKQSSITGIIIQLPLPKNIDLKQVIEAIPKQKDVDGMRFLSTNQPMFAPATSLAVLAALELSPAKPNTSKVVIIGQGEVGRPLLQILKSYNINVTSIARPTHNLQNITQDADVVISAVGKPGIISAEIIKDNAVLIDVGVSIIKGKTVGDIDFDNCKDKASFITPPLGGIGPLTVVMLLQNVIRANHIQSK